MPHIPRRRPYSLAVLTLAAALAAACARAEGEPAPAVPPAPPAPREIVVTAFDFAFRAPDTVPAGLTRIRLANDGPEMHHAQVVRIADGHTLAELLERLAAREQPAWATWVGGPNVAAPRGSATEVVTNLTPGQYALLCFVSSHGDRTPHMAKGMAKAFTVVPAPGPDGAAPAADVQMVLDDYSFTATPAITAGRHAIRVTNAAAQPHEVVLARLVPGKTAEDLLAWARTRVGPPPGEPMGGTVLLTRGQSNLVVADFTPGPYALICFAPDAKDGKPHVAHGMVQTIQVR